MGQNQYELFLEEKIKPILLDAKKRLDLDYLEAKFINEDGKNILKIDIDKDFKITLAQIEEFTKIVNEKIDLLDDDLDSYIIDISSPSDNRLIEFKDLYCFINSYIQIETLKGEKLEAKIESILDNDINLIYFIKGQKKKRTVNYNEIKSIKTSYKL